MKPIIYVFIANVLFLTIFANIYIKIKDQFSHNSENTVSNIDCWLFSSSIQSGCGFTYITPKTHLGKSIAMIQLLILISSNIIPIIIYLS